MEILSDRLKFFVTAHTRFKSIREFEREIGWKSSVVNNLGNGISADRIRDLREFLPELNIDWLITGKGEVFDKSKHLRSMHVAEPEANYSSNAKHIEEGEDYIWLETKKIPEKAGLSLATNYFAEVYLEELETGKVRVKREHHGKYWEVEATGESMDDGSNRILDKDWFLARDIPRDLWKSKLHINKWNVYYFLHNERGHIIKEVKSHNTETGELVLHSWNPDKELYGDFTINIKDCYIIANIVKLISRDFNIFY